jgi:RNA polymerase sigma-70 factor (ECF subfamily)
MQQEYADFDVLLKKLRALDWEAFDYLYVHSRDRLYVLAYTILKDETAAQDLVQDFFIDLWKRKLFLNIQSNLKAYLMRAVRNRAYAHLDKLVTQKKLKVQFDYLESRQYSTCNKVENDELGKELDVAIAKLPPVSAMVFQLHYIHQLSHTSIAEHLHISKSTVSGHMDKALRLLRSELKRWNRSD